MNKYTSARIIASICLVLGLCVGQANACGEDECGTDQCGCLQSSCQPYGHSGYFCTGNGKTCDLKGECGYSCDDWCTEYSNTCSGSNDQNGSSECGTM